MYPACRYMDYYPFQVNQMPYHHPRFEAVPPQRKVNPTGSPYDPWPFFGSYCHPHSVECQPCFHGARPPYPHIPPPLSHGGYYAYPEPYPPYYNLPSHYPESRYEYEKNMVRDNHCCGCPNHLQERKEDRGVKIEEQLLDDGAENNGNDSMVVPSRVQNYPYPGVWIPPGYMKNNGRNKPAQSQMEAENGSNNNVNPRGSVKSPMQQPNMWNGWFPVDTNKFQSQKQGRDEKRGQPQQGEGMNRLPLPVFWIPYNPEQAEIKEFQDGNSSISPKITPVKHTVADDMMRNSTRSGGLGDENSGNEVTGKNSVQKLIPVRGAAEDEEKKISGDSGGEIQRTIPVKEVHDNAEMKPYETTAAKKESSSSLKSSKLPPVCLRVDPLPRRRKANGSSRSPSPPGHKDKSGESSDENLPNPSNKRTPKAIGVVERTTQKERNEDMSSHDPAQVPVNSQEEVSNEHKQVSNAEAAEHVARTVHPEAVACQVAEDKKENIAKQEVADETNKMGGKKMSDAEAAVVIQSAYRGLEVRKWEPLKKLKQISELHKQVIELRNRIRMLETSSAIPDDDKQRMIIGEAIMSLLLKLDTIQGLHPSIRDIRKSVAKELVSLQEKLDSITTRKSDAQEEQACATAPLEAPDSTELDLSGGHTVVESDESGSKPMENSVEIEVGKDFDAKNELPEPLVETKEEERSIPMLGLKGAPIIEKTENHEVSVVEWPLSAGAEGSSSLGDDLTVTSKDSKMNASDEQPQGFDDDIEDRKVENREVNANELEEKQNGVFDEYSNVQDSEMNEQQISSGKDAAVQLGDSKAEEVIVCQPARQLQEASNEAKDDNEELFAFSGPESREAPEEEEQGVEVDDIKEIVEVPPQGEGMIAEPQGETININKPEELLKIEETCAEESKNNENHEIISSNDYPSTLMDSEAVHEENSAQGEGKIGPEEEMGFAQLVEKLETEELRIEMCAEKSENIENHGIISSNDHPSPLDDSEATHEESKASVDEVRRGKGEIGPEDEMGSAQPLEKLKPRTEMWAEKTEDIENHGIDSSNDSSLPCEEDKSMMMENDRKLIEENEKLREMVEKMVLAGKEQLTAISSLMGRVKDLEKRLAKKKKLKMHRYRGSSASGSSCLKPAVDSVKGRASGLAM